MDGVLESLAGRIAVVDCLSLSAIEVERWRREPIDPSRMAEFIFSGGFPELHARGLEVERSGAEEARAQRMTNWMAPTSTVGLRT